PPVRKWIEKTESAEAPSVANSCLLLRDLARGSLRIDADRTRLLLLWDFTLQLDREQTVGQLCAENLHVIGELEAAFEIAASDAAIEILLVGVAIGRGVAGDQ